MAEDITAQAAPAVETTEDAPIDLLPDPTKKPEPAKKEDDKPDPKAESATAYQLRKEKERTAQLNADLEKYKKREEEERKAKQTDQEKRDEEMASTRDERDRLKRENLIIKIGIDARLPQSMWGRIQGADEEAMRRDAEELAALVKRPAVGSATDPVRDGPGKAREITREQLRLDPKMAREANSKLASGEWKLVG